MGKTGSRESKVNTMDGRQNKMIRLEGQARADRGRREHDRTLVHRSAEGGRSMEAGSELETQLGGAGDEGGNSGRQQRVYEGESEGCRDHDKRGHTVQMIRLGQSEGERRNARVD
jgi:hypothetical protein